MTRIRTWCLPAELCTSCCRLGCGMHAAPIAGVWQAGVAWHASGYARPGKRVSSERVCAHIVVYLTYGGLTLRELCCLLGCVGLRCWCTCVFLFVVQPLSASFVVAAATPVQRSLYASFVVAAAHCWWVTNGTYPPVLTLLRWPNLEMRPRTCAGCVLVWAPHSHSMLLGACMYPPGVG